MAIFRSNQLLALLPCFRNLHTIITILFSGVTKMILTEQLRNTRIAQNKTLRQLAGETGISHQYISDIELGRKDPSLRVLQKLAEALNLTIILIPKGKN